jgi:TonB family protein
LICSKGIPLVRHECDSATGVVIKSIWYSPGQIDSLKEWNRSGTLTYFRKLVADTHHLWIAQNYYDSGVLRDSGLFDGITWCGKNYHWYENGKLNYIDTRNGYGSCIAYDVWTEKGVHVLHCLPSRGRDTVPEIVLSDNGRKLTYGTKEFDDQRNKYFPAHLEPYDEFTFYFPTIVVAKKFYMETVYDRLGPKYEERRTGGQAVYMELADSTATNRRDAPDFPGGNAGLSQYFRSNIQYPAMASEAGLQGTVWLQFAVDEKGQVNDCQILRGVTLVIDKEAERVVRYMPPWTPATKKGKAVKSRCVIGVKFVLVEG